jgi:hypothetical protein
VSRLVTSRRIEDVGQGALDLYESWPGDDAIDGRSVIAETHQLPTVRGQAGVTVQLHGSPWVRVA